jgi:hypothetical protein
MIPMAIAALRAGLKPGQTGICVASYIQTKWFKFPGRGDNRGTTAQGGTSRVEVRMTVDPKQHTVTKTNEHLGNSGVGCQECGPQGHGSNTVSTPTVDDKGNTHFQVAQDAVSAFKPYSLGMISGTIDNHLNLDVTPDGKVGIDPGSTARDFPSLEVYRYAMDENGNVTSTLILDKREATPNDKNGDLGHPEKPIKAQEPNDATKNYILVRRFRSGNYYCCDRTAVAQFADCRGRAAVFCCTRCSNHNYR